MERQPEGTVMLARYVPVEDVDTDELIAALKTNRVDLHSNWSYHGLRPGLRQEQDDIARELTRRGININGI